jgi:hypothetical protein
MSSALRLRLLSAIALVVAAGCGRSSLLGGYGEECPPGSIRDSFGFCIPPPDGGFPDLSGDGFRPGDLGDMADMTLPCNQRREICDDKADNNCNGLVDCKDPACMGDQACVKPGQEICNNGLDDDGDDLIDCKDPDCLKFPFCKPHMCDPDNPDCLDPACVDAEKCKNTVCKPTVDFGTLQKNDSRSEKVVDTTGTKDVAITPCAPGGGGMVVTEFTVASDDTSVRIDETQAVNGDHVFALFRAGVNQKCDANPLGCFDPTKPPSTTHTWVLDAGHYYLIVQAFTKQHQGSVDVILSTPPSKKPEICNNGVDDDGNNLKDCADPACFNDPACKNNECNPDINVGTLVVNDPPKHADFTTQGAGVDDHVMCTGDGGADVVLQFTLKETAGVLVAWNEEGDHIIDLFRKPPAGQPCDAQELSCYLPMEMGGQVAWGDLPPGDYLFIFKAVKAGSEGNLSVDISAYKNRKVELCHNGIDDDGDGLADCQDPDCFQDAGCGAPVCAPDVDLGTLHLGDSASTTVDTSTGIKNLAVSCAKGGGKAKVIKVKLAEQAGLGVSCNDTKPADNVEGLFAEAGPRDPCDKLEIECGDPEVIPFGCNYEVPNLQPGTYYMIVEAFQAGSEGKTNITLSSTWTASPTARTASAPSRRPASRPSAAPTPASIPCRSTGARCSSCSRPTWPRRRRARPAW